MHSAPLKKGTSRKHVLPRNSLTVYKKIQQEARQACHSVLDDSIGNMVSQTPTTRSPGSGIAPLKKDGISCSEPTDQVEILNEHFVSAFTKEDRSEEAASWPESAQKLAVLKEMASSIAPALALIYQAFYEQGQISDDLKRAFLIPLFKKWDKSIDQFHWHVMEYVVHSHEVSGEQQDSERLPACLQEEETLGDSAHHH